MNQPIPPGFSPHVVKRSVTVSAPREKVWGWLCNPDTFTKGNLPPWRVEFLPVTEGGPADFTPGVYTNHHGPFMNLPSIITEVRAPEYRSMDYLYGSSIITLRMIRPTRLQFWLEEKNGTTTVTLQLDSLVHRWWGWLWTGAQSVFWWSFLLGIKVMFAVRRGA
ncbi:MAG: hypothetical protein RL417_875 [Pseudomonadota bacterium]|jgi:hypothetical protein